MSVPGLHCTLAANQFILGYGHRLGSRKEGHSILYSALKPD